MTCDLHALSPSGGLLGRTIFNLILMKPSIIGNQSFKGTIDLVYTQT